MTTIKNVTEGKKKNSKTLLDFIVPIKLTTTMGEGGEKSPKVPTEQVKK